MTEKRPSDPVPVAGRQLQPLLVDIKGLAVLLGRSVAALERDQAAGRLPTPVRIGRSKRWRLGEIEAWIEAGCPGQKARYAR